MANNPISLLPAYGSSTPSYNDLWAIVNAGVTKKISVNDTFMKYGITTLPAGVNTPIVNGDTIAQMFANLQAQITSGGGGYTGPQSGVIYNLPTANVGATPLISTYTMPAGTLNANGQKLLIRGIITPHTGVTAGALAVDFRFAGFPMGVAGSYFSMPGGDLVIFTGEIVRESDILIRWYTRYEYWDVSSELISNVKIESGALAVTSLISFSKSLQLKVEDAGPAGNLMIQEFHVALIDI